ncbi:hypothetical protein [Nocardioides sp. InS609-2]|nr:hypothetical protein [Nocardioides sp. InS609-2]
MHNELAALVTARDLHRHLDLAGLVLLEQLAPLVRVTTSDEV